MSDDTFTEVTRRGWGSRLGASFKGILFGLVLGGAGTALLWWNEGRAVVTAKSLKEGAAVVVSVDNTIVRGGHEDMLVHTTGRAESRDTLQDPQLGVSVEAIALRRSVEMYQWQETSRSETKKKLGGGEETVTTYSYSKGWFDHRIDSSQFKRPDGHANPSKMPFGSETWQAGTVALGAFRLSTRLVEQISTFEPLPLGDAAIPRAVGNQRVVRTSDGLYVGRNPSQPELGDLRIGFSVVRPTTVSVVAKQVGSNLEPYQTQAGRAIAMLELGSKPADAMFKAALERNTTLTWILRAVGFFGLFLGLYTIFKPLAVLGDVVPIFGSALRGGIGFISFLIAAVVWLVVVALAWLYYRPLLGLGLLALAVVCVLLLLRRFRKTKPAAMPPPLPKAP